MQLVFLAILVSAANAATLKRVADPAEKYNSVWNTAEERKTEGNPIMKAAMGSIDSSVKFDEGTSEPPEVAASKTDFGYASPSTDARSATKDLSKRAAPDETVSAYLPAAVAAGASPYLYDPSKYQGGPITPEALPDSQKSKEARDVREGIEGGQAAAQEVSPIAEWFKNRATKASDMIRKSMPAPPDARPDHFESEQEEKVWVARQGNRIYQGDHGIGDLVNTLDGLKNLNNKVQAQIIKKFGLLETSSDNSVKAKQNLTAYKMNTKELDKIVSLDEKITGEIKQLEQQISQYKSDKAEVEKKPSAERQLLVAQQQRRKVKADQWEVTFYILLATCVFVFGWWAVKVGWHQRVAEAASEFAFSCKKLLSQTLKSFDASSYTPQDDMKSESSYEASEGTGTSESSKGALNKHLQGVIDRTKANLDDKAGSSKV